MQPTLSTTLARILRVRCPRCGKGAIFRTFFRREECCSGCAWKFERESGFWVGGSEVHMIVSYGISVVLFIPLLIILGSTLPVQLGVIFGHIVCSLSLFRLSRATFIGLDFYFDPLARPDEDGGDEGDPVPVPSHPRRPLRHSLRRRQEPRRVQPVVRGSRGVDVPQPVRAKTVQAKTARR
jgi:uncharacterized protein (DUF983 family)